MRMEQKIYKIRRKRVIRINELRCTVKQVKLQHSALFYVEFCKLSDFLAVTDLKSD